MRLMMSAAALVAITTSTTEAATLTRDGGSYFLRWSAFDSEGNEDLSDQIDAEGRDSVSASSSVNTANGFDSQRDTATYTLTNTSAEEVLLFLTFEGQTNGDVILEPDGPVGYTSAYAFTQLSVTSSEPLFSLTNGGSKSAFGFTGQVSGERLCTEPSNDPPFTPGSTCPYVMEQDNDTTGLDDGYFFLAGGSALSFDLEAYSESSIETTPVPLPASGALLALGIVGLAAAYRRKR